MTDYFERVVEIEKVDGVPVIRITKDRADLVAQALRSLDVPIQGVVPAMAPHANGAVPMPPAHAVEEIVLERSADLDRVQDLLDELRYIPDRADRGTIWRRVL